MEIEDDDDAAAASTWPSSSRRRHLLQFLLHASMVSYSVPSVPKPNFKTLIDLSCYIP